MAHTGSYAMTDRDTAAASSPAKPPASWRETTSSVRPPSRSCSVSPTQTMGSSPAESTALAFRFTPSSVSPNSWRRSEWPRITYRQPTSFSMGADTSPVNAPCGSAWQFWAASRRLESSSALPTG